MIHLLMYGSKPMTACSHFLSFPVFLRFGKRVGAFQLAGHHIAPFDLPTILAAELRGHILFQPHIGIGAVDGGGIDGIAAPVRLKSLIFAGHRIGAALRGVNLFEVVRGGHDITGQMLVGALGVRKRLFIFS